MDHEEIIEYLADRHELSDLEFHKEEDHGRKIYFTGYDNNTVCIGVLVESEGEDKANIYFIQDNQCHLEETVTLVSYEEFLAERMGI
jgi:hypothetical protein